MRAISAGSLVHKKCSAGEARAWNDTRADGPVMLEGGEQQVREVEGVAAGVDQVAVGRAARR